MELIGRDGGIQELFHIDNCLQTPLCVISLSIPVEYFQLIYGVKGRDWIRV